MCAHVILHELIRPIRNNYCLMQHCTNNMQVHVHLSKSNAKEEHEREGRGGFCFLPISFCSRGFGHLR